jgi:Holliday junction DNA helicase RuvA
MAPVIASVRGRVLALGAGAAVVECGGVGLEVHCTPAALGALRVGEEAAVLTSLAVREDAMVLYGFADAGEREAFATVQSVSGIGARIALALLATMTPAQFAAAVESGDVAAIQKTPGIGKKGAQRLVLELAGKLAGLAGGPGGRAAGPAAEVTAALVSLGWREDAASAAVEAVMAGPGAPGDVPGVLRAALRGLGSSRG